MFKKKLKKPDGRNLYLYSNHPIQDEIIPTAPISDQSENKSHLRYHPLRNEWVIYAPHRQNRTFLPPKDYSPLDESKDPHFPTEMPQGDYQVAVFENLFPSLVNTPPDPPALYVETAKSLGVCEVVVYTKKSDTSLGKLSLSEIKLVLEVYQERTLELSKNQNIKFVLPFENKGVEMGVTLHHPHGQIYAYSFVPPLQSTFQRSLDEYWLNNNEGLLENILKQEKIEGERIIFENKNFICFIPAFARYPYETWILPKKQAQDLGDFSTKELESLARTLKNILTRFDKLWNKPFPYLMTINQAPVHEKKPYSQFFIQFTPPLRTKEKIKFLAGTELGAGTFVNDSLPEEKAQELREVNNEN